MTVVLVAGAIAIVGAAVIWATWRRSTDEGQSVQQYHHTLETLRHLSARNQADRLRMPRAENRSTPSNSAPAARASDSGSVIGRSGPAQVSGAPASGTRRGVPVPPPSQHEKTESASKRRASTVSELASGRALYRYPRGARGSGSREPKRAGVLTAAAVVVLVAVVAVALAVAPSRSPSGHRSSSVRASSTSSGSRPVSAASTSTSASSGKPQSSRRHASSTTVPPTLQPTAASAVEAAYTAPESSYTVALSASGPCWILATDQSTGQVLWTGTLEAGETRQIPAAGSLVIRLGAAFVVTLTLDGEPVTLPAGHGSPFDVTFQSD